MENTFLNSGLKNEQPLHQCQSPLEITGGLFLDLNETSVSQMISLAIFVMQYIYAVQV